MTDQELNQKLRDEYSAKRDAWYKHVNGRFPQPSKSKGRSAQ